MKKKSTIQRLRLTILKSLGKILLLSSLTACGANYPKVTLHQLDTVNKVVSPFKITKVDQKACTVEVEELPSFPILGPELHGGYCLTAKEFGDYKAWLQAECKTQNETKEVN